MPRSEGERSAIDGPAPASSAEIRQRLLDLAYDVSSYLRRSARPAIRVSAALLVAASLAACSGDPSPEATDVPPAAPLAQEVRTGVPTQPGRYAVSPTSIARDARGVYHFEWIEPDTNVAHEAAISRVKLAEATATYLDVPDDGDPTLSIPRDSQIALLGANDSYTRHYDTGFHPIFWYPFFIGGGGSSYYGPSYYDPPRVVPSSGRVDGAVSSASARPLAERTFGVSTAVSGRVGGTGGGVAASRKAGVDVSSDGTGGKAAAASAATAKSGGFSSGGVKGGSGGSGGSASS